MAQTTRVNGLDMAGFEEALNTIKQQPGASHAPKKSRIRWRGGFKFDAIVRNHVFRIDEPSHLTGEDEAPNSMEYVLGAYGACLATGFVLNASRRGVTIYNMEVALDSTQDNAFTFLGIDDKGHSGFTEIVAKLFVQADADEATLQQLWDQTVRTSPVGNSLARNVAIVPQLSVV